MACVVSVGKGGGRELTSSFIMKASLLFFWVTYLLRYLLGGLHTYLHNGGLM